MVDALHIHDLLHPCLCISKHELDFFFFVNIMDFLVVKQVQELRHMLEACVYWSSVQFVVCLYVYASILDVSSSPSEWWSTNLSGLLQYFVLENSH